MSFQEKRRVPSALQAVFLASNRGREVKRAPPNRVGSRIFRTFFTKRSDSKKMEEKAETDPPTDIEIPRALRRTSNGETKKSREVKLDPQIYLDAMLKSRGYNTTTFKSVETAYCNKPTPLQLASYDLHLIAAVKENKIQGVKEMIKCGLSPNPSNNFGESLVHMLCRRGYTDMLAFLITEFNCDVQIADDYGRTPAHDAAWAPTANFEIVKMLLDCDPNLLYIADARGSLPLSYVQRKHWGAWIEFLNSVKDQYWAKGGGTTNDAPPLSLAKPNSRPLPDPEDACTLEVAKMVASGKLSPSEAVLLKQVDEEDKEDDEEELTNTEDYDEDGVDDTMNSDFSLFDKYEMEMACILKGTPRFQEKFVNGYCKPDDKGGLLACSC